MYQGVKDVVAYVVEAVVSVQHLDVHPADGGVADVEWRGKIVN